MMPSIRRAIAIDSSHPNVYSCIIKLANALPDLAEGFSAAVKTVVERAKMELIGTRTPKQLNEEFIVKNKSSIMHLFEGAKIMYELEPSKKDAAVELITSFDINKVKLEEATKIFKSLRDGEFGSSEEQTKTYKNICTKKFKYARLFKETVSKSGVGNHLSKEFSKVNIELAPERLEL